MNAKEQMIAGLPFDTHDETLARMTDRTLFMKDGSIVSPASVEE